jgi:hypothetical protein
MKAFVLCLVFTLSLLAGTASAQGVVTKSGATSDLWTINSNKAGLVSYGRSTRPTYNATIASAVTTAAFNLQVESPASQSLHITRICVGYALGATAAGTIVTTTVSRRTTASTGGTALTNEGTGTTSVSKRDTSDANFGGLARGMAATLGTAGATLDQWQFPQTVVAGTTGITQPVVICREYGVSQGGETLVVPAGVTNGIAVNVSAGGAGSLAVGSISLTFIQE